LFFRFGGHIQLFQRFVTLGLSLFCAANTLPRHGKIEPPRVGSRFGAENTFALRPDLF